MFRTWRLRVRALLTGHEARERMAKLEAAVQIQLYEKHRAAVDSVEGTIVANLIQSLEHVPSACITVGSLAILKYDGVVHARQLSEAERRALERFPDLHKDPTKFFESLADAAKLIGIDPPDPE